MRINRIKKDELKEKLTDLSCGVLATLIDVVLFEVFQDLNLLTEGYGSLAVRRATDKAFEEVEACGINKEVIKRTIWKAVHQKYIKRKSENKKILEITQQGLERIKSLLPVYKRERVWDGHLYLITYDIPEKLGWKRNILREAVKQLGGGMLQASVWITPYNPNKLLEQIVEQHQVPGSIIVSDLGKDGNIGEEDLDELVTRVYGLEILNKRYKTFIDLLKQNKLNKVQASFQYLAILKDDPQLPFGILPQDWLGDKAYQYLKEKFPS